MAMSEKEYFTALSNARASRLNEITDAVNRKAPKDKAGLKEEFEEIYYDRLWKEAEAHEKKYGFWPVFEMEEIDTDDPVLDIYKDPPGKWAKERKADLGIDEIDEG